MATITATTTTTNGIPRPCLRRRLSRVISGDRRSSVTSQRSEALLLDDPIRMLEWDDQSHLKVLTQIYGSVWPRVLPFCAGTIAITLVVYVVKHTLGVDLTCAPSGHKYMAMVMSFLVVKRVQICYDDYMSNSRNLQALYRTCRELVQLACLLTSSSNATTSNSSSVNNTAATNTNTNNAASAQQWRHDVAYATLLLLRTTMAVLEFPAHPEKPPWECPELPANLRAELHQTLFVSQLHSGDALCVEANAERRRRQSELGVTDGACMDEGKPHCLVHVPLNERNDLEEACRIPILMAYKLRSEILKQRQGDWLQPNTFRHPCNEEMRLLDMINGYLKAFDGLKRSMITPLPFPLVQMTKTALFVWLGTLPFCLCHNDYGHPVFLVLMVFFITFGFVGLELVAMELSDCFGDDPSDFDNLGHAQLCFEDVYLSIYRLDGGKWAHRLRRRLVPNPPVVSNRPRTISGSSLQSHRTRCATADSYDPEATAATPWENDIAAAAAAVAAEEEGEGGNGWMGRVRSFLRL